MLIRTVVLAVFLLSSSVVYAKELHVIGPKGLKGILIEVCQLFEKNNPEWKAKLRTGNSPDMAKVIQQRSAADVFLLGDEKSIGALKETKVAQHVKPFLADDPVIVAAATSKLEVRSPADLAVPDLKGVALFAETNALGKSSRQYLKKMNVWETIQTKVGIQKGSKSVIKSLQAGETDWGVLYKSDTIHAPGLKIIWKIPEQDLAPQYYYLGSVSASSQPQGIRKFLETIQSTIALKFFENAGFRIVKTK